MTIKANLSSLARHIGRPRNLVALFVGITALSVWGVYGMQIISTLNPQLGHELEVAAHPALDVWITSPIADASPIIISTPAGVRFEHDTITLPQGSTISAHLGEQDGETPELIVDGDAQEFTTDAHGDFAATAALTDGKKISIRRGWMVLATWKIRIMPDTPPQVALTAAPAITESHSVRVAYKATDDYGVTDVALRITPRDPMPGANNTPVDIDLPTASSKEIARVDFADLTSRPWAGQEVQMQIVATNEAGKEGVSDAVDFTLPERRFYHPVARLLVEERKKLMLHPDDDGLRQETANIMAGIAHETADFHNDPVVMMALRSGAVRLVLAHDHDAVISVNDILWQAATRIEDGATGTAQHTLRDAQQDLADALRHGAGKQEIDILSDHLQAAMDAYLSHIITRPKSAMSMRVKED